MRLTFVDLFCGVGGATLGYVNGGMDHVLGVEFDAKRANAYKHKWEACLCQDVCETVIQPGSVDVVVGSPPCQGFSLLSTTASPEYRANKRSYTAHFARVAIAAKPRAVVMENVPAAMRSGEVAEVVQLLHDAGYTTTTCVLCAADYGVATIRKRMFLMAGMGFKPTPPPPTHIGRWIGCMDVIGHLVDAPNVGLHTAPTTVVTQALIDKYIGHRFGKFHRAPIERPIHTIICSNLPSDGPFIHPTLMRGLTPLELALLQGFDADYFADMPLTLNGVREGIGNSVCPPVAAAIARQLHIDIRNSVVTGK